MYSLLHSPITKIAILGASCSPVSEAIASAAQYWNLVQVRFRDSRLQK